MFGVSGRVGVVLLLSSSLILLLVLGMHQAGFGWGQTQAARQAVQAALSGLPAQAEAAPAPAFGRAATPEEAQALDQTVNTYLTALREKRFPDAWELVVSEQYTGDAWANTIQTAAATGHLSSEALVLHGMTSRNVKLGKLETYGKAGTAELIMELRQEQVFPLVRREGQWRLDLDRLEELLAGVQTDRQAQDLGSGDLVVLLKATEWSEGAPLTSNVTNLLLVAPRQTKLELVSRQVVGDRAQVVVRAETSLHVHVQLDRKPDGWRMMRMTDARIVEPETPLRDDTVYTGTSGPITGQCLSNVKRLGVAMRMYVVDYDEKLPPADRWSSVIDPYVQERQRLQCPAVPDKFGYAINYKLSLLPLRKVTQPGFTVSLFDSTLLRPNAYDIGKPPGDSVTWPPRHDGLICYGFVDGHSQVMTSPLTGPCMRVVRNGPKELIRTLPTPRAPGGG